jgi:hypothetical protein
MALSKPKVVSVVKRHGDAPQPAKAAVAKPRSARSEAAKTAAKASRAKAVAPLRKQKAPATVVVPRAVREEPHIRKSDAGKPLIERLNPKLLAQLRNRKVTNAAAAEALGVHETYLSRVLKDMGEEKVKGATSEHREQRAKLTHARNQTREMLAKKVNRQEMTIERAAKEAKCSVRTMFRHCAKFAK